VVTGLALAACSGPSSSSTSGAAAGAHAPSSPAGSTPSPHASTSGAAAGAATTDQAAWLPPATGAGHLAPGSDPSVLPGPILIADKHNNRVIIVDPQGRVRWQFPRQGDLAPGQTFKIPDDAFFTPDGRQIIATEEDDYVVTVIDIATHRIVYRYGSPGHPGMSAGHLDNPDDAMMLPTGQIFTADIKNCRLVLIPPRGTAPQKVIGRSTNACRHDPPQRWGSPNGAFPMRNGDWLVTEINGAWVSELSRGGTVLWSMHVPHVSYPSDTNEISPNRYLTVDFAHPGQVVEFDRQGHTLWRYKPTGAQEPNGPSLAVPLPNGMVLLNDDNNHRVIVVDPKTNKVCWQYGHTGVAGHTAGYLNVPDGVDLLGHGLLERHASTMVAP
jgi:hypothetical protein